MKKILIHHKRRETSVAIINDDELYNYYTERDDNANLVGNIYKGKVQNVLPGIQAAFIDIGTEKNAFLQLNKKSKISIGQDIVIQIKKDSIGTKGPRATTSLSIPTHNLVLLPNTKYIGISHKIGNSQRKRLHEIAKKFCPKNFGLIIRTAAEECNEKTLKNDINNLLKFWRSIEKSVNKKKSPSLLYSDNDLMSRIVRDEFTNKVEVCLIDSLKITRRITKLIKDVEPKLASRIKRYENDVPIFERYKVDSAIAKLHEREIELPSGGFIVIDETEALIAIDVNTGKFVGTENLSDTAFKTNVEAAKMIINQLRLRDIGGIVIIDFIDMNTDKQNKDLLKYLRDLAKKEKIKTKVIDMTPLGLVEMTRKRSR